PFATQVGGDHYRGKGIQPLAFVMSNSLNFCQANVIKYIFRYKDKNGPEDLLKARHYIDLLLEYEYPEFSAPDKGGPNEEGDKDRTRDSGEVCMGYTHRPSFHISPASLLRPLERLYNEELRKD